jgi:hypothetical protein
VLTDVDATSTNNYVEVYGADGSKLAGFSFNAASNGLSFLGISYNNGTRIAKAIVGLGDAPLSASNTDGPGVDVIAIDDVIFGEPRAIVNGTADFDGDGGTDHAIFRPSTGQWFVVKSGSAQQVVLQWGEAGDVPVAGDYDGDGKTDLAVFRPSNGTWYIARTSTAVPIVVAWGEATDIPVPGDYDKDGKTDIAVFRPSTGQHFLIRSSTGAQSVVLWGQPGDIAVPGRYTPQPP